MARRKRAIIKHLLAALIVGTSLPAASHASVTYKFELLNGGARHGSNVGEFSFTIDDFVKPVTRFNAGAGNLGGSEYGQIIPVASLATCSIRDAQGPMPCGDQVFMQNVTSYTANGRAYDVLQFGMVMYPEFGTSYSNYYFDPGVFQRNGTFNSVLLADHVGRLTITSDAMSVPEPASWAMMILGIGAVGGAMRRRQRAAARISYSCSAEQKSVEVSECGR